MEDRLHALEAKTSEILGMMGHLETLHHKTDQLLELVTKLQGEVTIGAGNGDILQDPLDDMIVPDDITSMGCHNSDEMHDIKVEADCFMSGGSFDAAAGNITSSGDDVITELGDTTADIGDVTTEAGNTAAASGDGITSVNSGITSAAGDAAGDRDDVMSSHSSPVQPDTEQGCLFYTDFLSHLLQVCSHLESNMSISDRDHAALAQLRDMAGVLLKRAQRSAAWSGDPAPAGTVTSPGGHTTAPPSLLAHVVPPTAEEQPTADKDDDTASDKSERDMSMDSSDEWVVLSNSPSHIGSQHESQHDPYDTGAGPAGRAAGPARSSPQTDVRPSSRHTDPAEADVERPDDSLEDTNTDIFCDASALLAVELVESDEAPDSDDAPAAVVTQSPTSPSPSPAGLAALPDPLALDPAPLEAGERTVARAMTAAMTSVCATDRNAGGQTEMAAVEPISNGMRDRPMPQRNATGTVTSTIRTSPTSAQPPAPAHQPPMTSLRPSVTSLSPSAVPHLSGCGPAPPALSLSGAPFVSVGRSPLSIRGPPAPSARAATPAVQCVRGFLGIPVTARGGGGRGAPRASLSLYVPVNRQTVVGVGVRTPAVIPPVGLSGGPTSRLAVTAAVSGGRPGVAVPAPGTVGVSVSRPGAPLMAQGAPLLVPGGRPGVAVPAPGTVGAPVSRPGAPLLAQGAPLLAPGAPGTVGAPASRPGAPLMAQGAPLLAPGTVGAPASRPGAPFLAQGAPLLAPSAPGTVGPAPAAVRLFRRGVVTAYGGVRPPPAAAGPPGRWLPSSTSDPLSRRPAVVRGRCSICHQPPTKVTGHRVHPRGWVYCSAQGVPYQEWVHRVALNRPGNF